MNDPIDPTSGERNQAEGRRQTQGGGKNGKERAQRAAQQAKDRGKQQLEEGTERAASRVDDVAEAVESAASTLSELDHEGLADYASQLASSLGDISSRLRNKSVDEIAHDVRRIAERSPALFVLGSVAVGLGLSRFAKAGRSGGGRQDLQAMGDSAEWRGQTTSGDEYMMNRDRSSQPGSERQVSPDATGGSGL